MINMYDETSVQEVTTVAEVQQVPQTKVVKTTQVLKPPLETEHPRTTYEKKKVIFRTYQIIWFILGIVEILLTFRVLLKFIGANAASGFAYLIYALSDPFALPFLGVLGTTSTDRSVLEWSTLIAMVVYLIIAYGVVELIKIVKPTTPEEVEGTVDTV